MHEVRGRELVLTCGNVYYINCAWVFLSYLKFWNCAIAHEDIVVGSVENFLPAATLEKLHVQTVPNSQ